MFSDFWSYTTFLGGALPCLISFVTISLLGILIDEQNALTRLPFANWIAFKSDWLGNACFSSADNEVSSKPSENNGPDTPLGKVNSA